MGPENPIYRDLERLVHLEGADGWGMDTFEYESIMPKAMDSLCRVEPSKLTELKAWTEVRIDALGGRAEAQYKNGVAIKELKKVLVVERISAVLEKGTLLHDDCPFWLETETNFAGRQILDDRTVFTTGGGGKLVVSDETTLSELSGGGAGRFLLGRALGTHWMWQLGLEWGASAEFAENRIGERTQLNWATDVVLPLVIRYRFVNTFLESEAGYLLRIDDDGNTGQGVHVGVALGGTASRRRFLLPGGALALSYEKIFGDIDLHIVKFGFRIVFDIPL